jgi:hypothetical protein
VALIMDGFDLLAGYLYISDPKAYNPENKQEVSYPVPIFNFSNPIYEYKTYP